MGGERERAEGALGHCVSVVLDAVDGLPLVAGSTAGRPVRARAAWVASDGEVLARVAATGGRPSRARPVVADALAVRLPGGLRDQVVVAILAPEAHSARVAVAAPADEQPPPAAAAADGLALVRIPPGAQVVGVDALDVRGEAIGRLAHAGVGALELDGGRLTGRLGASHGMAAGVGAGRWLRDLDEAALEAGFAPVLPGWVPPGLEPGPPRVEPDVAYPSAPPAVVSVWRGEDPTRVLLRQAPAPLAQPERGGPRARTVDVAGRPGVLNARGIVLLVWETSTRAFGLQVRGVADPVETTLRIARSIPADARSSG